jgi:predicted nuclease with TOPRIM domain
MKAWLKKIFCKNNDEYINALKNRIKILEKIMARREKDIANTIDKYWDLSMKYSNLVDDHLKLKYDEKDIADILVKLEVV